MRFVWGALGAYALIGLILIIGIFPDYPKTTVGWVMLIVIGPPVYLLAEGIGEKIFSRKVGEKISRKGFSIARIIVATILLYGIIYGLYRLLTGGISQ
jgi:hypothetical protein